MSAGCCRNPVKAKYAGQTLSKNGPPMKNRSKNRSSSSSKLVPLLAKSRIPEQRHVAKKTPLAFAWLLTLPLLAVNKPLLSTALADGGAAAIVPVLLTTFTNPPPTDLDDFGRASAVMGNDRVVIGAPSYRNPEGNVNGAAYLFSTTGTLLTTFDNPMPGSSGVLGEFGSGLTAAGNGRLLIGASLNDAGATDAGVAYLFSTNGGLLTTFTNPAPVKGGRFGWRLAAVGSDRVLVTAPVNDATGATNTGAAYLFDLNGALVATFTNPTPASLDRFGSSVATVGTDRVLIGADGDDTGATIAGAAYLFSTNGALLTFFTNPAPTLGDGFGISVAAMGSDRVLIAAKGGGKAYLFGTSGTLLASITNPNPAIVDFGFAVASVGSDRILIGADGINTPSNGAAYLFNTNGAMLTTFTNPTPSADMFGCSVAALGSDRVLIGARRVNKAYLFALVPSLKIRSTPTNTLAVSWPLFAPDFLLQQNTNGLATGNWSEVTDTLQNDGTNNYIVVDPAVGNRFYRLSNQSQ
jgi:hypothetical protein